ncbi:Ribosome-binding factor A [Oceanicaulis sp. 350]|jgi:ribosome-binding factor A|nr:Ribosome-binding factor A [Oceanicaulis sp. 350]|tara:strand:- start:4047 stop:4430 length:384 start_codon:yes stop_codon:yes gene_type:complete
MKAQSQRQLRAGELVRRAVSDIIREGRVHDPHVNTAAVTITEARTSPDLRHATVYVDLLGGGDRNAVAEALNHASGFIQRELGKQIELKFTPKLRFAVDDRIEDVAQVDAVLDRPTVKRDLDDEGED